jgi:predicted RND superfamily exporter protein
MGPLSLAFIWLVLIYYYRRLSLTLLPFIPFLTGVGLASWMAILFHIEVSFVTLVGLVMLCGLSVDYGIFATDAARLGRETRGAWTAILFAALATISGFVPLVFCKHLVLAQLGQVLTAGTVGTLLGAFWGVPPAAAWLSSRAKRHSA